MLNLGYIINSVVTLIVMTFIGVFVANILMLLGLSEKAGYPFTPLMKIAKLPSQLSLPAVIGVLDSRAEHSIVSSYLKSSQINEEEVLVYNLVTSPIGTLQFMFRYYIPVVIAALGLFVGGMYVAFSALSSVIGICIGIAYAKLKLRQNRELPKQPYNVEKKSVKIVIKKCVKTAFSITIYVAKRYAVVLFVLVVLNMLGLFDTIRNILANFNLPLSPPALAIFATHAISPTAGLLMAGEILKQNAVTAKEAMLSMILGKFIYLLTQEYPRNSLPFYISMYPTKVAVKLTLFTMLTTVISTPISITLILLML